MKGRETGEAGFTVLEALVALAILSMVTAGVLSILSFVRHLEDQSRRRLANTLQAQALLERLGFDLPLEPGARSGTLKDGRTWMIEVSAFSDTYTPKAAPERPLYDVQVRVAEPEALDEAVELRSIRRGFP
jgi:general secretion pathway protein I